MKIEAGCLDRLSSHLRQRLDGDRRVGVGQLTLGGEPDQDARDVNGDGEPVGGVVVAAPVERDTPGAVRGLEERVGADGVSARSALCALSRREGPPPVPVEAGASARAPPNVVRETDVTVGPPVRAGSGSGRVTGSPAVMPLVHPFGDDPCTNP